MEQQQQKLGRERGGNKLVEHYQARLAYKHENEQAWLEDALPDTESIIILDVFLILNHED
ncbi:unnamed protein product [Dovyalis caffra]|uniref:Uncharacterized protein n=1 Tax=Dovyalis caffra TaxID=77055 RepID=A0AAV1RZU7_9ROSI|nr:unnamed protein product [Dovyalis caffra]